MIAAIDNSFLTLLLNAKAAPRPNPATGQPASHFRERIEALIDDLSKSGSTLLAPAPSLAEALSAADAVEAYVDELNKYAAIEIAPFDARAAVEFGRVIRKAIENGDKRSGETGEWQYVKMDRAIVAIAVSRSVDILYSDDLRQINLAKKAGLAVKSTWDLPLPIEYAQHHLSEQTGQPWPTQKRPPKPNPSEPSPAP